MSERELIERIEKLEEFHNRAKDAVEVAEKLAEIVGEEIEEWVTERENEVKALEERVSVLEQRMQ